MALHAIKPLCVLLSVCAVLSAADTPASLLEQARRNVAQQLLKALNYTCVQTVDREYLAGNNRLLNGCAYGSSTPKRREFMHDRLRLDVAVSEGHEIYSWHGENKFASSQIYEVVRTGPISSGGFIGHLHNIFVEPGIEFRYLGSVPLDGKATEQFAYLVPLSSSHYRMQTSHGLELIPFHGTFALDPDSKQLVMLDVIADDIPKDSNICSAETEMHYQMVNISGRLSLLPALFLLRIDDSAHTYTVSRNEYSQCREFQSESVLRFDVSESGAEGSSNAPAITGKLDAGIALHAALVTPIDDRTSYTGDPIEAVLLDPVKIAGTGVTIPKRATLYGIITSLQLLYEPIRLYLVNVRFDGLTYGNNSFELRAHLRPGNMRTRKLAELFGWPLPEFIEEQAQAGMFVVRSAHVHLDNHFSMQLITSEVPVEKPGAAGQ